MLRRNFEAFQTVENRAAVCAVPVGCITVGSEVLLVGCEGFPGMLCRLLQNDDHEGSHEKCTVSLLVELARRVMKKFHIFVALIGKQAT